MTSEHSYQGSRLFDRMLGVGKKIDPCIDLHLTEYLNQLAVVKAIHANPSQLPWYECSDVINYNFSMNSAPSMIPLYQKFFLLNELRILIYSGDVDAVVPFLGSETWTEGMSQTVVEDWRVWLFGDQQPGGFVKTYDTFTFLTIRGAGHMVPYFKPKQAYTFFERYINQQPF